MDMSMKSENEATEESSLAKGDDTTEAPTPALSKNAQKRILKAQRKEEIKVERRAREKAAKAAKKEAKRKRVEEDRVEEGSTDRATKRRKLEDGNEIPFQSGTSKSPKEKVPKVPFGAKIVIDLGFDDKMTEKEVISMVSQCAYVYSSNRKHPNPFSALLYTSLNGRTKARLDMLATYQNWRGVEWWSEEYDALWGDGGEAKDDSRTFTCPVTGSTRQRTASARDKVVYLTADSDVELLELSPEETYIIGGIVDKNRYKALCQNKAEAQSVRTARLPIGVYLKELPTRKVLTVNQVFDILLKWVEHRDWRKAFFDVIPERKFHKGKQARRANRASQGQASGENVDPESNRVESSSEGD